MTIKIIERVDGEPTEFDGKFVACYDPAYHPDGESYDGGLLEVVDMPEEAMQFPTLEEAIAKYRESYGTRMDGRENRPLTCFSVEIS